MAITLGSNIASLRGQRQLAQTSSELGTVFQRLSSGQRINKASDDAAGLSIADSLSAKSRIYNQGIRNLNDGLSLLSIADSSIENLGSIVMRLEELAEQAANGVYTNKQRKAIDAEAQALSKEFFRISKATEFNGQRLLAGEFDSVNLQAGVGANAVLSAGVGGAIGTGSFTQAATILLSGSISDIVELKSGDFNGDGCADLVGVNRDDGLLGIALNTGNGSFTEAAAYSIGVTPQAVSIGDFNNDGILDLITTDDAAQTIGVLTGIGNGTFTQRVTTSGGLGGHSILTGDFNNDGNLDFASVDVGAGTIDLGLGLGNGRFGPTTTVVSGPFPQDMTIGDFNGDGILDIVTVNGPGALSFLQGRGDGTFSSAVNGPVSGISTAVSAGDVNNDGNLDLVVANTNTLSVLLGSGIGTFSSLATYAIATETEAIILADFNGDGALDVALDNALGSVFLGTGSGTLNSSIASTGTFLTGVVAADFDGDGVLDLVAADANPFAGYNVLVWQAQTKDGVAPLLPFSLQTVADARQALPVFQRKREQLAAQRGEIGAFQSRIDVARNVLGVSSENFKAAESRIRDADIAEESSRLVRLNILQKAASTILAQANQQPALALQLLGRT